MAYRDKGIDLSRENKVTVTFYYFRKGCVNISPSGTVKWAFISFRRKRWLSDKETVKDLRIWSCGCFRVAEFFIKREFYVFIKELDWNFFMLVKTSQFLNNKALLYQIIFLGDSPFLEKYYSRKSKFYKLFLKKLLVNLKIWGSLIFCMILFAWYYIYAKNIFSIRTNKSFSARLGDSVWSNWHTTSPAT